MRRLNCKSNSNSQLYRPSAKAQGALRGLGLRRIGHTVELEDTPRTRHDQRRFITWLGGG